MSVSERDVWKANFINKIYFHDLKLIFDNFDLSDWPKVSQLNQLLPLGLKNFSGKQVKFSEPVDDGIYYEQRIYHYGLIETRLKNWHDFYNACIWTLFPQTKVLLNKIHIDEMKLQKGKKRTVKRDAVTHLDESGVIIVSNNNNIFSQLKGHQWYELFVEKRLDWGENIQIFIFGHGMYEKLLKPFIGLTAKAYTIEVEEDFFNNPKLEQYHKLDILLQNDIIKHNRLKNNQYLSPIPLLGIPGWVKENSNPDFYQNTNYFRPKNRG